MKQIVVLTLLLTFTTSRVAQTDTTVQRSRPNFRSVHLDPEPAMGWFAGLKVAGTDIPNIFRAGIFYQEGNFVFWDVRSPEKTIVIDLEDEHFAKLIVEVADPQTAARLLEDAISP